MDEPKTSERPRLTLLNRLGIKLRKIGWGLLSTPTTLEDEAYENAPKYCSTTGVVFIHIFKRLVFLGAVGYLFYQTYTSTTQTQQFIAADPSSGACTENPKLFTQTVTADNMGNWEGTANYKASKGVFTITLNGFSSTLGDFSIMMKMLKEVLNVLGTKMKMQELSYNMIVWACWKFSFITNKDKVQTVSLSGSPRMVMNNAHLMGTMSNVSIDCALPLSSQSYDLSGVLKSSFTLDENYAVCGGMIDPTVLGWEMRESFNTFNLAIDVNSLFTAIAVGIKLNGDNPFDGMDILYELVTNVNFNGVLYSVFEVYDPMWPGMAPLFCIGPTATYPTDWNCLLKMGNAYGFPLFTHRGANQSYPTPCDCRTNGQTSNCDDFSFFAGAVVYDFNSNASTIDQPVNSYPEIFRPFLPIMELLYVEPAISVEKGNKLAHSMLFASVNQGASSQFMDPTWRQDKYDWCKTYSFGYCTLISFESFDGFFKVVTEDMHEIKNGSCEDSVTFPFFDMLVNQAWSPLIENYYNCYMKPSDAFINALGISTGNAGLFYSFFMIFSLYGSYGILAANKEKEVGEVGELSEPTKDIETGINKSYPSRDVEAKDDEKTYALLGDSQLKQLDSAATTAMSLSVPVNEDNAVMPEVSVDRILPSTNIRKVRKVKKVVKPASVGTQNNNTGATEQWWTFGLI